jgi:hypothetical protein
MINALRMGKLVVVASISLETGRFALPKDTTAGCKWQAKKVKEQKKSRQRYADSFERSWWAMLGLNQRPLPCEGSALPLS